MFRNQQTNKDAEFSSRAFDREAHRTTVTTGQIADKLTDQELSKVTAGTGYSFYGRYVIPPEGGHSRALLSAEIVLIGT